MSAQPEQPPTALTPQADVLADAVRRLVDVAVRTQVGSGEVLAAAADVEAVTARLGADLRVGPWVVDRDAPMSSPYNTVVGAGNPLAAPAVLRREGRRVVGEVSFGAAYEGAPGLVHGGVLSLVLDQLLGEAAMAADVGGMTVRLDVRYVAPTPLHTELSLAAEVVEVQDRKVRIEGTIAAGGTTTVTVAGTFVRLTEESARALFPQLVRE